MINARLRRPFLDVQLVAARGGANAQVLFDNTKAETAGNAD